MKGLLLSAALLASFVAADGKATDARDPRTISDGSAPARFQGDNAAVVYFINTKDLQTMCGGDAPEGYYYAGCSGTRDGVPVIALPNPCQFDNEPYAHIACHELGHRNGWPATHGD